MRQKGMATSVNTGALVAVMAMVLAFVLQGIPAAIASADEGSLAAGAFDGEIQAEVNPAADWSATVTTDAAGEAYLKVSIGQDGVYSICSIASKGAGCDTIGYLYDASLEELEVSDDRHADTNFCICADLAAGDYFLKVTGKELQAGAEITVAVKGGRALNTLDCNYQYSGASVSEFQLGTWEHREATEWVAADPASFKCVGYVDRSVFVHAQESGAISVLAWKAGLPAEPGRFAVKVSAVGDAYLGDAYYFLDDRAASSSIAELDPVVTTSVCKALSSVELGKYTTVPTNWSTRWDAITAGYYSIVGYCPRSKFEALGGDEGSVTWTKGLPRDTGDYVIRCQATDVDENPFTDGCYVWASIGKLEHAGSGKWIVDKEATYSTPGQRHLACVYCGAACDYATIPAIKDTLDTAGSGATLADYKVLTGGTVRYEVCLSTQTTATVPDTVSIGGSAYKVIAIADNAFAGKAGLKSVKIGKNVASIGKNAFKGCKNMASVTIGDGVKSIGESAFAGCAKLKSLTIGKNVASIGKSAFSGCKKLKTLKLKTAKLKKASVKGCLKGSSIKTVKAPKAKKKAYAKLFTKKVCGKKAKVK